MRLPTIGVLGSHSAEEVGTAAKAAGFPTLVVCQSGREKMYTVYDRHLFDHIVTLPRFADIITDEVQDQLEELGVVWVPNRSFSVYVGYDAIERDFRIPVYGNRRILRIEERGTLRDQYWLLEQAGIRTPLRFQPDEIDRLVIVKVQQRARPLERAFFYATSTDEYHERARALVREGVIDEEALEAATIEEFIVAPRFNANFIAYGMREEFGRLDLAGFDDRVQTNLTGLLNLPARDQLSLSITVVNEEVGHKGLTMRESKKPLVYAAAEQFLDAAGEHFPPGMIGLFALQGAITEESEFVVFDVSPRVPGAPCVGPTSPEMRRLSLKHGRPVHSPMDLCMIDIMRAVEEDRLDEITT